MYPAEWPKRILDNIYFGCIPKVFEKETKEEKDQEFIVGNTFRRLLYRVIGVFVEAQQCVSHLDFGQ